jgi:hypothetical protein
MSIPRYAVLFKTHFWDSFAERQYRRYCEAAPSGTVFVCLDDNAGTVGPVDVPHLIRATYKDFAALGLSSRTERGNLLWWNTDYFHYLFAAKYPGFAFVVPVEYDSCCLGSVDNFVQMAGERRTDMAGLPTRVALSKWMWTRFHAQTYSLPAIRGSLNAISLFSARAIDHLFMRRRTMATDPTVRFWPGNEVFLPTEIDAAGYKFDSLDIFGDATRFEWHPPILEDDLPPAGARMQFLHPVLDKPRYIASQLRFAQTLQSYFHPNSALRQDLARFPEEDWRPHLVGAAGRRLRMRVRERLEGWGARLRLAAATRP